MIRRSRINPSLARNLALADRVVVTDSVIDGGRDNECDPGADIHRRLRATIALANPAASIVDPVSALAGPYRGWVRPSDECFSDAGADGLLRQHYFRLPDELPEERILDWLAAVVSRHGRSILRIHGLLSPRGTAQRLLIQGAGHLIGLPYLLSAWPDGLASSGFVVFAVDGVPREHFGCRSPTGFRTATFPSRAEAARQSARYMGQAVLLPAHGLSFDMKYRCHCNPGKG